ncbi:MAG TPA: hypothetical protein VGD78_16135 [Chthoniobacterales bacterium]
MVANAVTLAQLVLCSMAGFAFARLRFPGRQFLFFLLLASLMIPNQVTVIPIFLIMKTLGLVDNHLAIILPGMVSAFGISLMRQFYLTLPQGIALLQGYMQSGNPAVVMAAVTLAILPILIVFVLAQRWIVDAFVHSGLKG